MTYSNAGEGTSQHIVSESIVWGKGLIAGEVSLAGCSLAGRGPLGPDSYSSPATASGLDDIDPSPPLRPRLSSPAVVSCADRPAANLLVVATAPMTGEASANPLSQVNVYYETSKARLDMTQRRTHANLRRVYDSDWKECVRR